MPDTDRRLRLQRWLNAHGAALAEDGQGGPLTRGAVIEVFRNRRAELASDADIAAAARAATGTLRQMKAIAAVESGGTGWDGTGLLQCLYERHKAFGAIRKMLASKRLPGAYLALPKYGGYTTDADHDGINDSWEKLAEAAAIYGPVAFEWASFGMFQIMGFNAKACDYPGAIEMAWQMSRSQAAHYEAFGRFIQANGLATAFRATSGDPDDCRAIAAGFNGRGYERNAYHEKIAAAFRGLPA